LKTVNTPGGIKKYNLNQTKDERKKPNIDGIAAGSSREVWWGAGKRQLLWSGLVNLFSLEHHGSVLRRIVGGGQVGVVVPDKPIEVSVLGGLQVPPPHRPYKSGKKQNASDEQTDSGPAGPKFRK